MMISCALNSLLDRGARSPGSDTHQRSSDHAVERVALATRRNMEQAFKGDGKIAAKLRQS